MFDLERARSVIQSFQELLEKTPVEAVHVRLRSDAWTLAEIVGHLIDSAGNNHQRYARLRFGDLEGFPGYEAEPWVQAQNYDGCDFKMLAALWASYNDLLLHLAAGAPQAALKNVWVNPDGGRKTLEFLMEDYFVHLQHHEEHYSGRLAEVEANLANCGAGR